MKLALLIHDFHLEVGHSRAMIEHVRNLPQNEIEMIKVVSYTSSNLDEIFPELTGRCELVLVPFPKLYPTLF